tara:strand:+ start:1799 stop:2002 length:204 start_codon:yes stop_codon:yes gene_type:complete
MFRIIIFFLLIFTPSSSYAYIGPGMGGGFLAVLIGLIVAFFAFLFAIIYFPIKRFIKNKKNKNNEQK